ncbi:MAG: ASCH domain-containing protein [Bacteroidales bacterium]|nr:ASCH domain-containing protein [Bacteroidales bacterium]MBN2749947.1 ASCH domain-containing protein [Bacteroidales bacterium]
MNAITIKQPWAWLACNGIKPIENRTWKLPKKYFGQRILIHAGADKALDKMPLNSIYSNEQLKELLFLFTEIELCKMTFAHGAIIGAAQITDCVTNHPSVWAMEGYYHWVLEFPQLFSEPIPAKGKLSFWDYPNILAKTEKEYGEPFCHCQLPVDESSQVYSIFNQYRCHYCGGIWYK